MQFYAILCKFMQGSYANTRDGRLMPKAVPLHKVNATLPHGPVWISEPNMRTIFYGLFYYKHYNIEFDGNVLVFNPCALSRLFPLKVTNRLR